MYDYSIYILANCTTPYIKWRDFLVESAVFILQNTGMFCPILLELIIYYQGLIIRTLVLSYYCIIQINSDENDNQDGSNGKQKLSKSKRSLNISSVMQILIEVTAERSEGVATNLTDKDFIELLKLSCKRYK